MKISIITPTLNSAKTLPSTMESVFSQDHKDLEYIIIDGKSTDDTMKVVSDYQARHPIKWVSEKDNGIYDAMNKGIKIATGDIVGILNSDDLFDNGKVLTVVNSAFSNGDVDVVYGDIKYFKDNADNSTRWWKAGVFNKRSLQKGWTIPHPALFVRKSVYDEVGLYDTSFKIAGDYEFILRLLVKHDPKLRYVPSTFVRMYQGGISGRSLVQRRKGWEELRRAWEANGLKVPCCFIMRRILSKLSQLI